MENIQNEMLECIIRHLNKEATPPEELQLKEWLEADAQNKASFEALQRIWMASEEVDYVFLPDTETAWEKVKGKTIGQHTKPKKINVTRLVEFWGKPWQVAAALVIGIGIGFWVRTLYKNESSWTVVEAQKEKKKITLPDSSIVWLNHFSSISYADFKGEKREVKLNGEAFFEIQRKPLQPFTIEGKNSLTEVLGTSFNLKTAAETGDQVEVVSGIVAFSSLKAPEQKIKLIAGEKGILQTNGKLEKSFQSNRNFRAWQNQTLEFENTPLIEVAQTLERYFGQKVILKQIALENCRFTGHFEKPNLDAVLNILAVSVNLRVEKNADAFYLIGEGCN